MEIVNSRKRDISDREKTILMKQAITGNTVKKMRQYHEEEDTDYDGIFQKLNSMTSDDRDKLFT